MSATLSRRIPGVGTVAGKPVGDRPLDPPTDPEGEFVSEHTSWLFAVESRDLHALASHLEWLWYSPRESEHDRDAIRALTLIADSSDDAELGRLIRERTRKDLMWACEEKARSEWDRMQEGDE